MQTAHALDITCKTKDNEDSAVSPQDNEIRNVGYSITVRSTMILFNCEVSRCLRYINDLEMWNKETYELIFGDNLIRNRDLIENVENSRRRRPRKKIGFAVLFHL